jgi:DNA replication protein DnaC
MQLISLVDWTMTACDELEEEPLPQLCTCGCGECLKAVHFWMPKGYVWRFPTCSRQMEVWEGERQSNRLRASLDWLDGLFGEPSLGPRQEGATLENYQEEEGNTVALQAARDYLARFEEKERRGLGLAFQGDVGLGKTHLAAAIVLALQHRQVFAYLLSVPIFLRKLYDAMDNHTPESELITALYMPRLLVLNDLGAEHVNSWAAEKLFQVLDHRYNHLQPVLVTSNLSLNGIRQVLGARIADRLAEMCGPFLPLQGQSHRFRQAQERRREELASPPLPGKTGV